MRLMFFMLLLGLALTGSGIYLLIYTPVTEQHGQGGLLLVSLLIALGLLLLIPAKVYLILKLTARRNRG